MHILGIDIQGEVTLVDKEWTRVEKRDSDIIFKNGVNSPNNDTFLSTSACDYDFLSQYELSHPNYFMICK